jgi:hypothetical protein
MTDLQFSGAISSDMFVKKILRSTRAAFKSSIARGRDLFDENMTISSA